MESSKRIKTDSTATKSILDLPSDLLNLILCRLDQDDLCCLSLVSKLFLVLSNQFIRKLTFKTLPSKTLHKLAFKTLPKQLASKTLPKDRSFSKIFTRFYSVNRITIQSTRVARTLIAISNSKLNLETLKIVGRPTYPKHHHMVRLAGRLKKIKSLTLDWFSKVGVDQVIEFIQLFPALEELNFGWNSEQWDDVGFEKLSLKVPNLRSLSMRARCFYLTYRTLNALLDNCVNLEHVGFESCRFTPQDFCSFLRRKQNLRSVDLPIFLPWPEQFLLPVAETVSTCENLHHLTISQSLIKDDFLGIILKSRASLTTLKMKLDWHLVWPDKGYTMEGLSALLCAFQGLTRLEVILPRPQSNRSIDIDKEMSQLVKSLPCLTVVVITSHCSISATLFSLIENCPSIECICIRLISTFFDRIPVPLPIRKNYNVKHISLYPAVPDASWLKRALESYCPSVKKWDVSVTPEELFNKNTQLDWI